MKAVFVTGGKQYYVSEGDTIYVELLDAKEGSTVTPTVKGASIECKVEKHGKNKKIVVFKYRPKKKFRKKQGHRQPYTKLVVTKINK